MKNGVAEGVTSDPHDTINFISRHCLRFSLIESLLIVLFFLFFQHQVSIISGETGSGKTTQVPQYILDNACKKSQKVRIICTEPRRIAAITVSERVAQETGTNFGDMVGYQIRQGRF